MAMADRLAAAPAVQRGCRRGGEQAGANDLGGAGTRPRLAPLGVAGCALTTKTTTNQFDGEQATTRVMGQTGRTGTGKLR